MWDIQAVVSETERQASGTLFNRDDTHGWLPLKPTRLFMYDVIARAQLLSSESSKPWWVTIPSGHWRMVFGYFMLTVVTADVFSCTFSIAFCHAARTTETGYTFFLPIYTIDVLIKFASAVPIHGGRLEMNPAQIAKRYLQTTFVIDVLPLLPLEFAWESACWPEHNLGGAGCGYYTLLSWQWLRICRWACTWYTCDNWRSVTSTSNDGLLQTVKYLYLLFLLIFVGGCLLYWAALSEAVRAYVADTLRMGSSILAAGSAGRRHLPSHYFSLSPLLTHRRPSSTAVPAYIPSAGSRLRPPHTFADAMAQRLLSGPAPPPAIFACPPASKRRRS